MWQTQHFKNTKDTIGPPIITILVQLNSLGHDETRIAQYFNLSATKICTIQMILEQLLNLHNCNEQQNGGCVT
jgi:hypothetical protein